MCDDCEECEVSRDGKKIISLIDEKGRAVGRVSLVLTSLAVRLNLSIAVALLGRPDCNNN